MNRSPSRRTSAKPAPLPPAEEEVATAEATSKDVAANLGAAPAKALQKNLQFWAAGQGIDLQDVPIQAGWVNYDFQGLHFGRRWLVGDAAGLSSALTGEGIYPAVCSGEAVAAMILSTPHQTPDLEAFHALVKRHKQHKTLAGLVGKGRILPLALAELFLLLLRVRAIDFRSLEMAVTHGG